MKNVEMILEDCMVATSVLEMDGIRLKFVRDLVCLPSYFIASCFVVVFCKR